MLNDPSKHSPAAEFGTRRTATPEHSISSPLSIHDMTVAYHRTPVIWDIDYDAPIGKLVAIVGPNGAGKTTLIKAALGLVPKASGRVQIFGKPYRKQRSRVGYVPQRESVDWDFPVNALQVVAMGLYRKIGWCLPVTRKYHRIAMEALDRVGMAGKVPKTFLYANRDALQPDARARPWRPRKGSARLPR